MLDRIDIFLSLLELQQGMMAILAEMQNSEPI
jgi:hypothetical protein